MNEWLERNKGYVVSALAVIVLAGVLLLWVNRPRPAPIVISTPEPSPTPTVTPSPTPAALRVYVTGAVRAPDVYVLPPGSIVKDAIAAAGGAAADADLDRINLAVEVYDQLQVYVPRRGEETLPVAPPVEGPHPTASQDAERVNINTASAAELEALTGIGPAIAQRIVDHRAEYGPFAKVEDLTNVSGIGPATFDKLKDSITTE